MVITRVAGRPRGLANR